jgi:perosamine synthetase
MKFKKIPSAGPSITQTEIDLVTEAIKYGWGDKMNFYIDKFVDEFSAYIGIKYCLPTAHCTDAIHLAMLSLDIGVGDEVIVPDLTWVSSASPITYVGATPVFADVDPVSWCITARSIERCISSNTKAVVVVDLLGNMPDWKEILDLCQRKGIRIIEDAAEGLGATYEGKQAGSFGEISLFSFNATKMIMAGQGGALCTNDYKLYKKAKLYSHHGIDKELTGKYYWSNIIGYNYNWTNIQAALALAQLQRIQELIHYKKWLFKEYKKHLDSVAGLKMSSSYDNVEPVYWISVAIIDSKYGLDKEKLIEMFQPYNIDIRPMFYPISSMPPFVKKDVNTKTMFDINPISYNLSKYAVCLPNGNNLNAKDVEQVCNAFKSILQA